MKNIIKNVLLSFFLGLFAFSNVLVLIPANVALATSESMDSVENVALAISESMDSSVEPEKNLGSIEICKIILDEDGNSTTGKEGSTFTISFSSKGVGDDAAGVPDPVIFNTPLVGMKNLFGEIEGECKTIENLPFGKYYYNDETISDPENWETPKYFDSHGESSPQSPSSLDDFNIRLVTPKDNPKYDNYDGSMRLNNNVTTRTLFVLNQMKEKPAPQCIDEFSGSWADSVVEFNQGKTKNGSSVLSERSNENNVLGESDWISGHSTGFISLGFGGSIIVSFDSFVPDVDGNDISIHEATNGIYPLEKADIYVSQNGTDWILVGTANNTVVNKITYIDFSNTGLSWIKYVKVVDTSDPSLFPNDADGFDLDAIDVTEQVCDQPKDRILVSTVKMCKNDEVGTPLSGWQLMLLGDKVGNVLQVSPNGNDFTLHDVPAGNYVVKASGRYTYRGTVGAEYSDAAYSKRATSDPVYINSTQSEYLPWVRENNFPSPHTGWLGIIMNNLFTDWGSVFNPAHIYVLGTTTTTTSNMSFKIMDDYYSDNSGSIGVDVYKGYQGITEENGCVVFNDVPYGTYKIDEIMKDGWENVSGLGEVVVDNSNKTFTIINSLIKEEDNQEEDNQEEDNQEEDNQEEDNQEEDNQEEDNQEEEPTPIIRSSGSYISRAPAGQVLGAQATCGIYVDKFLKKGLKGNDIEAVKKVQQFLNDYMKAGLKVDGIFGSKTDQALKAFQVKHADKILTPWGLKFPTGIFYLTTQTEVNNIMCPELNLPIPPLVPMALNPLFPKA